jgi:pyridoxine 4-dehydrogenase
MLHHMPRFQPEVFDENIKLVHAVEGIAQKKGVTPAQIAIGWVLHQSGKEGMPTLIPIPGATTSVRVKENMQPAKLDESDMKELAAILEKFPIVGDRYQKAAMHLSWA